MEIEIITSDELLPTQHAHSLSMVIKSFKGRRNVEVHLFRSSWTSADEASEKWSSLITTAQDGIRPDIDTDCSRNVIMECFTASERDDIVNYLKEQYSTRLTGIRSTPLTFPVPAGLSGLTQLAPGKGIGFIEFNKIPSYPLEIQLKGFYDLNQHSPIIDE